jgi:hypothetical protein
MAGRCSAGNNNGDDAMNIVDTIHELIRYYDTTRGVGHTCALMEGVGGNDADPRPVLVGLNQNDCRRLKRDAPCCDCVSIHEVENHGLIGRSQPLVIDNGAMYLLLRQVAHEIGMLEAELEKVKMFGTERAML